MTPVQLLPYLVLHKQCCSEHPNNCIFAHFCENCIREIPGNCCECHKLWVFAFIISAKLLSSFAFSTSLTISVTHVLPLCQFGVCIADFLGLELACPQMWVRLIFFFCVYYFSKFWIRKGNRQREVYNWTKNISVGEKRRFCFDMISDDRNEKEMKFSWSLSKCWRTERKLKMFTQRRKSVQEAAWTNRPQGWMRWFMRWQD